MLLYFICTSLYISAKLILADLDLKCTDETPSLQVSESSVVQMPTSINNFYDDFPVYTIKPGVQVLSFNCSSRHPVLWKIYPTSAFVNSQVSFYTEVENPKHLDPYICYTTTITLLKIDVNASGSYACGERDRKRGFTYVVPEVGLYLYGGTQNSGLVKIGRDATLEQPNDMFEDRVVENAFIVRCTYNYPQNLSVLVTPKNEEGEDYPSFEVSALRYSNVHCISFLKDTDEYKTMKLFWKNGGKLTCKIQEQFNKIPNEIALVNILPFSDNIFEPIESNMTLYVGIGEFYTFTCHSTQTIEISTDFPFDKTIMMSTENDHYYKSQAKLRIKISEEFETTYLKKRIRGREKFYNLNMTVICKTEAESIVQEWNYLLRARRVNSIPPMTIDITNRYLSCLSPAPSTVQASFVPCSTLNDCQMKSQLLYTDQVYQLRLKTIDNDRTAQFRLKKSGNSSHVSGMGRCVGFQQDVMSIFFAYTHPTIGKRWGALNNAVSLDSSDYFRASVDKPEIYLNEFVVANCTVPLMLIISHSYWEFEFRNKSYGLITSEYITESNESSTQETLFISTRIQIHHLEVTGISCTNEQLVHVSPFIWKNGVFTRNADKIKTDQKRALALIKVNQKIKEEIPVSNAGSVIGLIFGILFVIVAIVAVVTFYLLRSSRRENQRIRQEEIDKFKEGNPELISPGNSDNPQNSAYDKSVEINLEDLDIDYQCPLGSGQFGIVYKGTANHKARPLPAAIKTLKPYASGDSLRAMMAELKIMLYIKTHSNVIKVIGACTNHLIEHQLYIVLEFCSNGDLHAHLRKNSQRFLNLVTRGIISPEAIADAKSETENASRMTSLSLIKWSSEIANGMAHISNLNVIHGDLAARNILLDQNLVAKISDFGLSKNLYQYSLYVRKRVVPVPWRWLAVESLAFTEFSTASDVWSYGVTLWEIFSLGTLPYPGQEYNQNFIQMLKGGFRLPLPEFATYEIYNVILECWKHLPTERPKFDKLKIQLDAMMSDYTPL